MTVCQVNQTNIDDDYIYITSELCMYYDMTELRNGYRKALVEEEQKVTNEQLRMLGYSEEDIANKRE